MDRTMPARLMVFKAGGDGDQIGPNNTVLVDVTDVQPDGVVELAFTTTLPGRPRLYIALSLPQLVAFAMQKPE